MNNLHIMIVDDDRDHLESLKEALTLNDFDVSTYENPVEAVEAYKVEPFDVVITDYKMPEMNGIEVLRAIRKHDPEAYVLIMTGYANKDNAIEAVNNGAYFFFRKPIELQLVIETLDQIEKEMRKRQEELNMIAFAKEYKKLKGLLQSFDDLKKDISSLHGETHEK